VTPWTGQVKGSFINPPKFDTDEDSIPLLDNQFHDLSVSFDRRSHGLINVFFDGKLLSKTTTVVLPTPRIALETWLNARSAENLDTGFRGHLQYLNLHSEVRSTAGWNQGMFRHIFCRCCLLDRSPTYAQSWRHSVCPKSRHA
jgi:hypothetical protein